MHRLLLWPRMLASSIFTLLLPPYPWSLNLSASKIFIKTFHDPNPITPTTKRNIPVWFFHHCILFLHNTYQVCNCIYVVLIKVWFPPQTSRSTRARTTVVLFTIVSVKLAYRNWSNSTFSIDINRASITVVNHMDFGDRLSRFWHFN